MKQVQGYVFISKFRDSKLRIAFGKNSEGEQEPFEKRLNNYATESEARDGARKYFEENGWAQKSGIYSLSLRYAETREEVQEFERESNLVVMLLLGDDDTSFWHERQLIGPIVDGKLSLAPIPGAKLQDNGYKTFTRKGERTAFERVKYCWSEVRRQGQLPCAIGQLKMKKCKG